MLLSNEEALARLSSGNNLANRFVNDGRQKEIISSEVNTSKNNPPLGVEFDSIESNSEDDEELEDNQEFDPDGISDDDDLEDDEEDSESDDDGVNADSLNQNNIENSSNEDELIDENDGDELSDEEIKEYNKAPLLVITDQDREIFKQITARQVDYPNLVLPNGPETNFHRQMMRSAGRKEGIKGLTPTERTEIAILARTGQLTQEQIADKYGITQGNVSFIARKAKKKDHRKVEEKVKEVHDEALERLFASVGFITNDKMMNLDAVKLSAVAGNLAKVVEKTRAKEDQVDEKSRMQVIVFAPETKKESAYRTIELSKA